MKVTPEEVDRTALEAAKELAASKKESDYSVATWAELVKALEMKEDVQSEIDAKTAAINAAIEALDVDRTALEAAKE